MSVGECDFQSPLSHISYAWLQQHGLRNDGSAAAADADGDRFTNSHEWRAGTDPANAHSVLRLLPPPPQGTNLSVTWESVPGRSYFLEWSAGLGTQPAFAPLAARLPSWGSKTTFTHTNAPGMETRFYRLGAEE